MGTSCNSKKKAAEEAARQSEIRADQEMAERNERIRRDGREGRNDRYSNNGQNGRPGIVGKGGAVEGRNARQGEMFKKLGMSNDQIMKFKEVSEKYRDLRNETRNGNGENRDAVRQQMEELQLMMNKEVQGILDPGQYQNYIRLLSERGPKGKGRPMGE